MAPRAGKILRGGKRHPALRRVEPHRRPADADDRGNGDEKENIVLDGNEEDSSNKQKLNDGQSSDNDNNDDAAGDDNQDDGDSISPDSFGNEQDPANTSGNDYEEEPEDDNNTKGDDNTENSDGRDITNPSSNDNNDNEEQEQHEDNKEGTSQEQTTQEDATTAEDTTKQSSQDSTTVEPTTKEESTTVEQSQTVESSTTETTTTKESTKESTIETTINNIDTTTTTKQNISTDSETTTDNNIAPEEATESEATAQHNEEEATSSETEKVNIEDIATESEAKEKVATNAEAEKLLDVISTESEMNLVKSTESNVIIKTITRYIKATKSEIATKSQWKVKSLLSDSTQESGAIVLNNDTINNLDKYMADTVKVLLVDQYGNEKVIRVKADWEFDIVDLKVGTSVDSYNKKVEERKNETIPTMKVADVNIDNATDDKKQDGEKATIEVKIDDETVNNDTNTFASQKTTTKEVVMEYVGEVVDTNIDINDVDSTSINTANTKATTSETLEDQAKTELMAISDTDMVVSKVVYEYVDVVVEGDIETANENDLKPEKMIVGNADNKSNTKNMPHAIYPRLNTTKLLENITKVLALEEKKEEAKADKPVYLSSEVSDEKIVKMMRACKAAPLHKAAMLHKMKILMKL